jgi:hypothetical protein
VHDHVGGDRDHRFEARWHLREHSNGRVRVVRNSRHTTVVTPAGRIVVPASVEVEIDRGAQTRSDVATSQGPTVVLRPIGEVVDIVTVLSPGHAAVTMVDQTFDGLLHCSILRGSTTDLIRWAADTEISWERWSA